MGGQIESWPSNSVLIEEWAQWDWWNGALLILCQYGTDKVISVYPHHNKFYKVLKENDQTVPFTKCSHEKANPNAFLFSQELLSSQNILWIEYILIFSGIFMCIWNYDCLVINNLSGPLPCESTLYCIHQLITASALRCNYCEDYFFKFNTDYIKVEGDPVFSAPITIISPSGLLMWPMAAASAFPKVGKKKRFTATNCLPLLVHKFYADCWLPTLFCRVCRHEFLFLRYQGHVPIPRKARTGFMLPRPGADLFSLAFQNKTHLPPDSTWKVFGLKIRNKNRPLC